MTRWTGLAPWEFEFPFPGSLTSTFLCRWRRRSTQARPKKRAGGRTASRAARQTPATSGTSVPTSSHPRLSGSVLSRASPFWHFYKFALNHTYNLPPFAVVYFILSLYSIFVPLQVGGVGFKVSAVRAASGTSAPTSSPQTFRVCALPRFSFSTLVYLYKFDLNHMCNLYPFAVLYFILSPSRSPCELRPGSTCRCGGRWRSL